MKVGTRARAREKILINRHVIVDMQQGNSRPRTKIILDFTSAH